MAGDAVNTDVPLACLLTNAMWPLTSFVLDIKSYPNRDCSPHSLPGHDKYATPGECLGYEKAAFGSYKYTWFKHQNGTGRCQLVVFDGPHCTGKRNVVSHEFLPRCCKCDDFVADLDVLNTY